MPLDAEIYGHREAMAPSLAVSTALHAALVACVLFLPGMLSHSGENWGNNGSGGATGRSHQRASGQWNSLASQSPGEAGKRAGQ